MGKTLHASATQPNHLLRCINLLKWIGMCTSHLMILVLLPTFSLCLHGSTPPQKWHMSCALISTHEILGTSLQRCKHPSTWRNSSSFLFMRHWIISIFDGSPTCSARAWVVELDTFLQQHQISKDEAIKIAALHFEIGRAHV